MASTKESQQPPPFWDRILSASQRNNATEIEFLIAVHGISPNHTNQVGQSALHVAALWGNVEAVAALLKYEADTNIQNRVSGATPLHSAVQSAKKPLENRIKCIQLILDTSNGDDGCNPQMSDFYGFTALDALEDMMEKGERCNEEDMVYYNQMKEILSLAVSKAKDNRNSIFSIIDEYEMDELRELLAEHSDEHKKEQVMDARDIKTGLTPLFYAIEKVVSMEIEFLDDVSDEDVLKIQRLKDIICSLLDNGAETSPILESNGVTQTDLLPMAPVQKNTEKDRFNEICRALSSLNMKTEDGNCNQAKGFIEEIASNLSSKGISVSPSTKLLFHDAARRGNVESVRFWVEKLGVDINLKGRQGLTALHFAARSGRVGVVKYLLENKSADVDVNALDDRGKTALDAAMVNNKVAVVELLQQFKQG